MYEQIEKPKENKRGGIANSVSMKKRPGFGMEKTFSAEVRVRPIKRHGKAYATHAFIALLDCGRVVDSLSFDPNNSNGLEDRMPENSSCGSEVIGTEIIMDTWTKLKDTFQRNTNQAYSLESYNCTHAIRNALNESPSMSNTSSAIQLCHRVNRT